jgi:hypothetical protein
MRRPVPSRLTRALVAVALLASLPLASAGAGAAEPLDTISLAVDAPTLALLAYLQAPPPDLEGVAQGVNPAPIHVPDGSMIDDWGITYRSTGAVRGVALESVARYQPETYPVLFRGGAGKQH